MQEICFSFRSQKKQQSFNPSLGYEEDEDSDSLDTILDEELSDDEGDSRSNKSMVVPSLSSNARVVTPPKQQSFMMSNILENPSSTTKLLSSPRTSYVTSSNSL